MTNQLTVQQYVNNDSVQTRINKLLDKRAGQFTTSLLTAVNSNERLAKCKPETVLNAALTAASLDLPINQNLGFAALVPYNDECQFQMMWKGYVQLAQRSRQYRTISSSPVYEGQLYSNDPLRGITFNWSVEHKPEDKPIGYASFFQLMNGFEKTLYMTVAEVEAHAKKYSKAYQYDLRAKKSLSPWSTNFEAMASKTVLKLLISKFGPLSSEMETALVSDSAVITDEGRKYVDNDELSLEEVGADEDKKNAIIAANKPLVKMTDPDNPEELDKITADDLKANMDKTLEGENDNNGTSS